jgi:hypothetical protein
VGPMRSRSGTINALGVFEFTSADAGKLIIRSPIGDNFGMAWLDDRRFVLVQSSTRLLIFDVATGAQRRAMDDLSRGLSDIPPVVAHDRRTIYRCGGRAVRCLDGDALMQGSSGSR